MDAGWAAVIGAVSGGVLAGVPALVSSWWSRQSQREQIQAQQALAAGQLQSAHLLQVMEPRRRVYGDFIVAVHHLRTELYEAWDRCQGQSFGPLVVVLEEDQFFQRLESAWAQVALEGPDAVVAAAESVMGLLGELHAHAVSVHESGIMSEFIDEQVGAPPQLAELQHRLDRMIAAARKALAEHGAAGLLHSTGGL